MERPKKIIVVDASVAVKWFVEEEFTDRAISLLEDYERRIVDLRSVQLMPFEVLNALRYNTELGQTELNKAGEALLRFGIAYYPVLGDILNQSLRLAYVCGLSIYDASYLSLSQFLSADLYTADEKLIEKAKGEGVVHHIGDYGPRRWASKHSRGQ